MPVNRQCNQHSVSLDRCIAELSFFVFLLYPFLINVCGNTSNGTRTRANDLVTDRVHFRLGKHRVMSGRYRRTDTSSEPIRPYYPIASLLLLLFTPQSPIHQGRLGSNAYVPSI